MKEQRFWGWFARWATDIPLYLCRIFWCVRTISGRESALRCCGQYDLVFVDPPYDSSLAEIAVKTMKEFDILAEGGIIICETRADTTLPEPGAPYKKRREYRYGKVKLTTFVKET